MILLADYKGPDHTARKGPDQIARMRRLVWAFAVRICPETHFRWRGSLGDVIV